MQSERWALYYMVEHYSDVVLLHHNLYLYASWDVGMHNVWVQVGDRTYKHPSFTDIKILYKYSLRKSTKVVQQA